MKKQLIVAALLLTTQFLKAQKDSWYVGGQVGFSSTQNKQTNGGTTTDNGKVSSWSFSPEVGTFLTNHVQVGVGLLLRGQNADAQGVITNKNKVNSYGGLLYGRYFWGKNTFRPFAGVRFEYTGGKSENTFGNVVTESKTTEFGAAINSGFSYNLSKKVFVVGFNYSSSEPQNSNIKNKQTNFGFDINSLGNRFDIGLYVTL
jgi:outer membrane protein W